MATIVVFLSLLALSLALPQNASKSKERNFHLDGKIVGGTETNIQQYPYMVSLRGYSYDMFGQQEEYHMCGASIISNDWVLTAGHCCTSQTTDSLVIRVGNTNCDYGERHEVSEIVLHPNYVVKYEVPYNDACLIRVATPFQYSDSVKAVNLPSENSDVSTGTMVTATGWGSLYASTSSSNSGGDTVEKLQQVSVPIVSHSECVSEYGVNKAGANYVDDSMICAGYDQGGKDACQGDSGGPLTLSGTQVGIVSWGSGCAEANAPGIYTNLGLFRSWIRSTTGV